METPEKTKPKAKRGEWLTPERAQELLARRRELAAQGNKAALGGRPKKVKVTVAEAREEALKRLEPKAIRVLEEQLDSSDPKVAQTAAIKVLEHKWGKATQRTEVKQDGPTVIRYETTAISDN